MHKGGAVQEDGQSLDHGQYPNLRPLNDVFLPPPQTARRKSKHLNSVLLIKLQSLS